MRALFELVMGTDTFVVELTTIREDLLELVELQHISRSDCKFQEFFFIPESLVFRLSSLLRSKFILASYASFT